MGLLDGLFGDTSGTPQITDTTNQSLTRGRTSGSSSLNITAPDWVKSGFKGAYGNFGDYADAFKDIPPELLQAWGMAGDVATGQDPYNAYGTSMDYLSKVAQGDYLYGGAAFNQAVDAAYRAGMPGVLSRFAGAGRSDGGLAKVALARAFSDPFALQYGQERTVQDAAARSLPQFALGPSSILAGIGQDRDARTLQGAQLQQGALPFLQPWLGQKTKTKGTSTYNTSGSSYGETTPAQYGSNPLMSIAGGGLAGYEAAGPWGALGGGLIGAIGSLG